jgi:hypothetical protein
MRRPQRKRPMTKTLYYWASTTADARPFSTLVLQLLAAGLQAASNMLTRVATRMEDARTMRAAVHTVEFHAVYRESGAPEGALFVNGELVGVIDGVTRL